MAEHGLDGTDFDAWKSNSSPQGLTYYITAKLLWDPNLDVNEGK